MGPGHIKTPLVFDGQTGGRNRGGRDRDRHLALPRGGPTVACRVPREPALHSEAPHCWPSRSSRSSQGAGHAVTLPSLRWGGERSRNPPFVNGSPSELESRAGWLARGLDPHTLGAAAGRAGCPAGSVSSLTHTCIYSPRDAPRRASAPGGSGSLHTPHRPSSTWRGWWPLTKANCCCSPSFTHCCHPHPAPPRLPCTLVQHDLSGEGLL